jgi:hypothetical protein
MTDPTDETQPHPIANPGESPVPESPASPIAPPPPGASSADAPPPSPAPPLRAKPDRAAASDWREPPWFPPRERPRDRGPSLVAIVVGLSLLAVGIYYFLDRTLGLDIPAIRWSSVWPIVLIVFGGLIVLRALRRR